jgi:hypothetical protein
MMARAVAIKDMAEPIKVGIAIAKFGAVCVMMGQLVRKPVSSLVGMWEIRSGYPNSMNASRGSGRDRQEHQESSRRKNKTQKTSMGQGKEDSDIPL